MQAGSSDFLGEKTAATRIEDAVSGLLQSGKVRSLGTDSGHTTSEIGDMVAEQVKGGVAVG